MYPPKPDPSTVFGPDGKPIGYKAQSFHGIDFKVDPNAPPGKLFFMNEKNMEFYKIDTRTRWQRFKDWFKNLVVKWRVKRLVRRKMEAAKAGLITKMTAEMDEIWGDGPIKAEGLSAIIREQPRREGTLKKVDDA